jgi:hypothetical protein
MEPSDPSREKENVPHKEEKTSESLILNKRTDIRYIIRPISVGALGSVVEISKGYMKIRKMNTEEMKDSKFVISFFKKELKVDLLWQNNIYIGIKYSEELDLEQLIKKLTLRVKEPAITPKKTISDDAIAGILKKDVLSICINFMEELENQDTDITKLQTYVDEISDVCQKPPVPVGEATEELDEINELKPVEPTDLKELLIYKASSAGSAAGIEIKDVDFAIARLGLEAVKEISVDFLRNKLSELEISPLTSFDNYESFVIFKTVVFKHLAHFFGFKDEEGEGSLLLSLETKGLEILMHLYSEESEDLRHYYKSPSRIYSELSRIYETNNFGKDLLQINKYYFENVLERFEDIYDGYIIAHLILNPSYVPGDHIKLTFTRKKLIYSFMVYLTLVATKVIMDRDKESVMVLMHRLKRAGMTEKEILNFLAVGVSEANKVLKDLGLKGNIRLGTLPSASFKIEGYLHKDIYSQYLVSTFKDFSMTNKISRLALRYEDEAYTHFILTKLMIADDLGLNSKAYCVIPCRNISEYELYLEEFIYFDIVIFKDIDSLPISHRREFMKLWKSFEGKIIVTFSNYSFIDFDNKDLYLLLKDHIVDFPSYFYSNDVYERMIDHVIDYMQQYSGKHGIDRMNYLSDICSMNYIKTNELQSYR